MMKNKSFNKASGGRIVARLLITAWLAGAALGVSAQQQRDHYLEVAKHLDIFNQVYKNLELLYVDTLNPQTTIGKGIAAMLGSLDPYTEYYGQDKTQDLRLMLTGKYAGIGALIRKHLRLDQCVIDEPYADMPAAEAGLRKGDIILSIDEQDMTDKTVNYVSEHLRGEPGTSFVLKVKRPSTGKTLKFKLTRRNIKMPALPYYGMRGEGIGYINLNSFTEGCAKEMRLALIDLKRQGATKLVLDLRGNPGGSEQEAVDILNLWLPKGLMVVENRGKIKQASKTYTTRVEPLDTLMPMVVMVNGESASASEITSGALQDLKRAVILGTRTYGKGLVQIPIDLPYNTNMKVTTSRYYLPSGRCVQGKGVEPDVVMKGDTIPNIAFYLSASGQDSTEVMFDYVVDYIASHPSIDPAAEFRLADADWQQFKQRVIDSGFSYDPLSKKRFQDLVKTAQFEGYYDEAKQAFDQLEAQLHHDVAFDLEKHRETLCRIIEMEIISAYHYQAGMIEAGLGYDRQLKEAERLLSDETAYSEALKNNDNTQQE